MVVLALEVVEVVGEPPPPQQEPEPGPEPEGTVAPGLGIVGRQGFARSLAEKVNFQLR